MKRKKTKLKIKKKSIIVSVVILLIVIIITLLVGPLKLYFKGYSFKSSFEIAFNGTKSIVLDKDYSETLDNMIIDGKYDKNYLSEYFEIDYYDRENFTNNTSNMLRLRYDAEVINKINKKNDNEINKIASTAYYENLKAYLEYDYFKPELFERYEAYNKGNIKDTLIKVNIGLDKPFYKDPNTISKYSTTMLVNTYNKLDESFTPELVKMDKCSEGENYLSKEAKEAFDKLCDASLKDGMKIGTTSSYRSYKEQQNVYNYYLKVNGQDYVNKYVAKPGFSEHQTGLALDVKSVYSSPFKNTKEYIWMINNAYKYGFILRYPENTKNITGYNSEAWHFRYVGIDAATYIQKNKITYDEYCAIFM